MKYRKLSLYMGGSLSCPARGTWIEIKRGIMSLTCAVRVVPRKGHVD